MTTINGTTGADTLTGTAGNDLLLGDTGADVYRFGIGSGQDTIWANHYNQMALSNAALSTLEFGPGIEPGDLIVSSALGSGGNADDMLIRIAGTQDSLLIVSQLEVYGKYQTPVHDMGQFKFASGEVWTADQVRHMGSSGADYFRGNLRNFQIPDVFDGQGGADSIDGYGGSDTLSGGDGDDFISAGSNGYTGAVGGQLNGGAGDDILIIRSGTSGGGASTVNGGAGDDYIVTSEFMAGILVGSAVRYEYSKGFGADTILGHGGAVYSFGSPQPSRDRVIVFDATVQSSDIEVFGKDLKVTLSPDDPYADFIQKGHILLRVKGTNDSILTDASNIDVQFADGTTWAYQDLFARAKPEALGDGDDFYKVVAGNAAAQYDGGAGRDIIISGGSDTLLGGVGDDLLNGDQGAALHGGDGHDTLLAGRDFAFTARDVTMHGDGGDDVLKGGYRAVLYGGSGNDTLLGLDGSLLDGGADDDVLRSVRAGSVTYRFDRHSGQDTIKASEFIQGKNIGLASDTDGMRTQVDAVDTIELAADIGLADLQWQSVNGGVLMSITGSDTSVLIETPVDGLKRWHFRFNASGDVLTGVDLARHLVAGTAAGETLIGTAGDDQLMALGGQDTLDGGAGNDLLHGGEGRNTYRFGANWGHDTIEEAANEQGAQIVFTDASLTAAQLAVQRVGRDLVLRHAGSDSRLTILDFDTPTGLGRTTGPLVTLANGQQWSAMQLLALANEGTDGNDQIIGTAGAEQFNGLGGNDLLQGGAGDDVLNGGEGDDTLYGDGPDNLVGQADTISGGDGADQLFGGTVQNGGAGNDALTASGQVTFAGGAGDDRIYTTLASQVLIQFGRGEGVDQARFTDPVSPPQERLSSRTVALDDSILPEDLIVSLEWEQTGQPSNSVNYMTRLRLAGSPDSILLDGYQWDVHFLSDGSRMSATDVHDRGMRYMGFLQGTDGADQLTSLGRAGGVLWGGDGHDTLTGQDGVDVLSGDNGNDVLRGLGGDDTLRGGLGVDVLDGGAGADTYRFMRGWGADTIVADGQDTILLGDDILRSDVQFRSEGDGIVMSILGTSDSITLANAGSWGGLGVRFGDGQVLSGSEITADFFGLSLIGTAANDVLVGGRGDDTLSGLAGRDTLTGGLGRDTLNGGKGNDTYVFNRGDGQDTIVDSDATWFNSDLLKVGDVKSSQLWFTRSGDNLGIAIIGTKDTVTVQDWFKSSANRVEKITALGDGKSLSASRVNYLVNAMASFTPSAMAGVDLPTNTPANVTKLIASSWM